MLELGTVKCARTTKSILREIKKTASLAAACTCLVLICKSATPDRSGLEMINAFWTKTFNYSEIQRAVPKATVLHRKTSKRKIIYGRKNVIYETIPSVNLDTAL